MSRSPRSEAARRDWGSDDTGASILHVDMDAFFAAAELIERPDLVGYPVIVGGQQRGVVLSCTYEARAAGVRSAMPMRQALGLCPQAVVIAPRHDRYQELSRQVMRILGTVTPVLEPVSIDEAFLDVSGARRRLGTPVEIASMIRQRIASETGLVASVGVASTKFVAKLASSHAKPNGLLLVPAAATLAFLHSLPVGALWGVGERTEKRLHDAGIAGVVDLAHTPPERLRLILGSANAGRLHDLAWGRDPRPVQPIRHEKSIGHEQTFAQDLVDRAELSAVLLDHAHRCAARLRVHELVAGTASVKIRLADFTTLTRSRTLDAPTDVAHDLYAQARTLLSSVAIPATGVRLLGLRCESLTDANRTAVQLPLDADAPERREAEVAMDQIREKFGQRAVRAAALVSRPATTSPHSGLS